MFKETYARKCQRGIPPKKLSLSTIGLSIVKMVADWHIHDAYHNRHWRRAF